MLDPLTPKCHGSPTLVIIFFGVGDDQCGGHEGEADNDEDQPRPDPHHPRRPPEEWYT